MSVDLDRVIGMSDIDGFSQSDADFWHLYTFLRGGIQPWLSMKKKSG
ncbi:MAG: hypothetical protein J0L74_12705 [Burkholderiales bacterium]|nr:hypothetical protein [Burkholderiales bacterium]